MKGKLVNDRGAAANSLSGKLGGTGVPFHIDLRASRPAPRTLQVTAALTADGDSDLTMIALGLNTGPRFEGEGRCTVSADGADKTRAVPFGRGPTAALGSAVSKLRFTDAGGAAVDLVFAKPVAIVADGDARIVLAADKIAGGTRTEVSFTVELPADMAWYPTPAEIPFPADWDRWFVWNPTAALTANPSVPGTGISMAEWSGKPAGADGRVTREDDQLLVGGRPVKFWGSSRRSTRTAPCFSAR